MLKIRFIPVLLVRGDRCVKGINFTNFRDTGNPVTNARIYDSQGADELVVLNIGGENRSFISQVQEIADQCFMPLTFGGGISSVNHVRKLMKIGADKVSINTAAVKNPSLISKISKVFGSQAVVVSIDAKKTNGGYEVFVKNATEPTGLDPFSWAKKVEELGAGEILITSIDNEGTMKGYDIELTKKIAESVRIPVIASGGAGKLNDFVNAVTISRASAVAAGSFLHFTDQSIIKARMYMKEANLDVRYKA